MKEQIITNPYALNMASIMEIDKRLDEYLQIMKSMEAGNIKFITSQVEISNIFKKYSINLSANYLARARIILAMMAFEGFVNLLTYLFLKKEYRSETFDRKVYQENIDIRLLYLNTHCFCFNSTAINKESELFKAVQHLIGLRNNLVHANIHTKSKKEKFGIPSSVLELKCTHSYRILDIIRKVIISCLANMKNEYRYLMTIKHTHLNIGFVESDIGDSVKIMIDEEDMSRLNSEFVKRLIDFYLKLGTSPTAREVPSFDEFEHLAQSSK